MFWTDRGPGGGPGEPSGGPRPGGPRPTPWASKFALLLVLLACATHVSAAKKAASSTKEAESAVIEEVSAKQLERVLNEKDYVAVFWCKCVE